MTPKKVNIQRTSNFQQTKKTPNNKEQWFFMVKDNKMTCINSITIFHQNICGLTKKTDELKSFMYPNFPHILCFSEHHTNIKLNPTYESNRCINYLDSLIFRIDDIHRDWRIPQTYNNVHNDKYSFESPYGTQTCRLQISRC